MASIKERYLNILVNGANLTSLCDVAAQSVGNPVALTLQTRTIIARSRDYTEELLKEYTDTSELMTEEEQQENYEIIQSKLLTRRPFIGLYPYLRHKRMNYGCFWQGNLLAVIDVPLINKVIIDDALHLLEEAGSVFTSALLIHGGLPKSEPDPMEIYLIGLLRGDVLPEYQMAFHYNVPFRAIQQWRLVWCKVARSEYLAGISGKAYSFCACHPSIWCTTWTGGIVFFLDAEQFDLIYKLKDILIDVIFGVSEVYSDLTKTQLQYARIRFALDLSEFEGNKEQIVFVQKYKTAMFFLSHAQNAPREEYKSTLTETIKNYDVEHNSEYYPTLRAYLLDNMDVKQMASDLNIHKNTVTYRLQRISELFDINLSDCRVITELYLSLFDELIQHE